MSKSLGTPTDVDKATYSVWIKRCSSGTHSNSNDTNSGQGIVTFKPSNGNFDSWKFNNGDHLDFYSETSASQTYWLHDGPQDFRDFSAWMHLVVALDSTQSTAADRFKVYVNGTKITNPTQTSYISQNTDHVGLASGSTIYVGLTKAHATNVAYANCYMAELVFIDGTQYAASDFGEFDSNSPTIWKPKDPSGLTFGNNGFYLDFKDSANLGNDSNGGTDLTETNIAATDQATDSPTNSFATWNPLIPQGLVYAEGNLSATHDASSWKSAYSTHAMSGSGKYYFETKISALGSYQGVGIIDADQISSSAAKFGASSRGYGYKNDANKTNGDTDSSYGATYTTNDIIGCALDLTNGAIYFSKNGAWQNSATTAEIAAGTTTNAAYTSISSSYVYLPAVQIYGTGTNILNAGNPPYALTSAVNDGNGYGNFEYTPPSGFLALCTKNLGSDGG